jgi:hypothetical protein
METAVRKATRLDYNPPKQKHLQSKKEKKDIKIVYTYKINIRFFFFFFIALISLTFQSPGNAASIIDLLDKRLRENSWIVCIKEKPSFLFIQLTP